MKALKVLLEATGKTLSISLDALAEKLGREAANSAKVSGDHQHYKDQRMSLKSLRDDYWENRSREELETAANETGKKITPSGLKALRSIWATAFDRAI